MKVFEFVTDIRKKLSSAANYTMTKDENTINKSEWDKTLLEEIKIVIY